MLIYVQYILHIINISFIYGGKYMDIKQMYYFKTIVEQGTISNAAKVLHMAQPPLSIQLKQLEDELNVQLLKRGHRSVELTDAGKLFYKRCIQMISLSELTYNEMQDIKKRIIRIGITSSNSALIQNQRILDFFRQYPEYSFQIHEGTTYQLLDSLLSHVIDIGFVRTPFNNNNVNAIYLEQEPMYAVGTKKYITQKMNTISYYSKTPLIIHRRYNQFIIDFCINNHFNPFIKCLCDDVRTSIILASSELGVAIVPESALSLVKDNRLITVPLEHKALYTGIAFITRKDEEATPIITQFINSFKDNKKL